MDATVLEALKWTGIALGIAASCIVVFRLIFAVCKWFVRLNDQIDSQKEIKDEISHLRTTTDGLKVDTSELKATTSEVKVTMANLQISVDQKLDAMRALLANVILNAIPKAKGSSATETNSPLTLSKLGRKISKDLDLEVIAHKLADDLKEQAIGLEDFEIHELSTSFIRKEYKPSADVDRLFKKYVYNEDIPRLVILEVLALVLRDKLLKQNGLSIP